MPVKIFFPRIPSDQDSFLQFVSGYCNTYNAKIAKNKDGSPFCILPINYSDSKGNCANDIIESLTGKVVGDITLKPRIYVENTLRKDIGISDPKPSKDDIDDVVSVTHYNRDFYYVQLLSESDKNKSIGEYLSTLYEECRSNMLTLLDYDELSVNGIYASTYRNENRLFRIRVLDKVEDEEIKVLFIDYGNVEYLFDKPILEISEKIASVPPLAHKCAIIDVCIKDAKKHDQVAREVLNRNYKAKIIKSKNNDGSQCMSVDFLDFASVSYRKFLIFEGVAADNGEPEPIENHKPIEKIPVQVSENGVKETCAMAVMTHIDSLNEFYVQLANKAVEEDLLNITKTIGYLTEKLNDNLQFVNNSILYLSQFSADGNWYRCKINENKLDDKDPHYTVQYIDFGNTEKKSNVKDIKPLTLEWCEQAAELAEISACATKCSFSKTLTTGLSKAKVGRSYFRKEFIQQEKIFKISYRDYSRNNNKEWTVDNVTLEDDSDFMSKYCCAIAEEKEVGKPRDYYRLCNIESLGRMWFQLVSTEDNDRNKDLQAIKTWTVGKIPVGIKRVSSVSLDKLYCAVNKHEQLFRCRVIGRNECHAIVQFIDTGIYDIVKVGLLYPLPASVASIKAVAQSYRLGMNVAHGKQEVDVERRLVELLSNADVTMDLSEGDTVIKDMFMHGTSVLTGLVAQGLVEGSESNDECGDGRGDVDFSLPSVDKMGEVPSLVARDNSRVQVLRKLFPVIEDERREGEESVFQCLWSIAAKCDALSPVTDTCNQVDHIAATMASLDTDFKDIMLDRRAKSRDLQPLLERRAVLCDRIFATHHQLRQRLDPMAGDLLPGLLDSLDRIGRAVQNLLDIFGASGPCDDHECGQEECKDVEAMQTSLATFQATEEYGVMWRTLEEYARLSDEAKEALRSTVESMVREYDAWDSLPDSDHGCVCLVDRTYDTHEALKAEYNQYLAMVAQAKGTFDVVATLVSAHKFLSRAKKAVHHIVAKSGHLDTLHCYAQDMVQDHADITSRIDDCHRNILTARSALRHAVPDLEDAEELDMKERQQELQVKIHDIRLSLQAQLRHSAQFIDDPDIRKLMLKKPELQMKNQSILLYDDGVPIFLWDSIYFDMSQESSSTDSYIASSFIDTRVKMKKMPMSSDDYRSVLGNFTVYSSRATATSSTGIDQAQTQPCKVALLPVLYSFLSKCGNLVLYLIVPDFVTTPPRLPTHLTDSVTTIVTFFREVIDQIVAFWHLGFIYTEEDLRHGLLLSAVPGDAEAPLYLPLPLASLVYREKLSSLSTSSGRHGIGNQSSINVYMRQLGQLMDETLKEYEASVAEEPEEDLEALKYLACVVTNCGDVDEAETVCEDLGRFLARRQTCVPRGLVHNGAMTTTTTAESMSPVVDVDTDEVSTHDDDADDDSTGRAAPLATESACAVTTMEAPPSSVVEIVTEELIDDEDEEDEFADVE